VAGDRWWFSPIPSTNKTYRHYITEILLNVKYYAREILEKFKDKYEVSEKYSQRG
jgi:NDP-sugar pyrophosphorylase family protein